MESGGLPIPSHFDPESVGKVWRVPYQARADGAGNWAKRHGIQPASRDTFKIMLLVVDVQNTFCIPEFELFVGGRSGTAAVEDNRRLCEFIYRNLDLITRICPTLDTHHPMQIFHSLFLVDGEGNHPAPFRLVSSEEIEAGAWKIDPEVAVSLGLDPDSARRYLRHYTRRLKAGGKYDLTIWPFHAMLGGIGHALVSAVEEAVYFHGIARYSRPDFQVKGDNPLTENYSVLSPEILEDADGKQIAEKNSVLIRKLTECDACIIAGQAKSHCVAWTISDLLSEIDALDRGLARKVYLLEDCTSPVVVPGVADYTEEADAAFQRFADAGMHVIRSTETIVFEDSRITLNRKGL